MATLAVNHRKKAAAKKEKKTSKLKPAILSKQIPAGEFKAKCLALIDEVNRTGQELVITKRGKPLAKLISVPLAGKRESIIGRLEGIIKINGDPDDLVNPIFPQDDWDMLK